MMLGNATSFERFCCSAREFGKVDSTYGETKLTTVANTCFSDLNISMTEKIMIIFTYAQENALYKEEDCHEEVCLTNPTPSHIAYLCVWILVLCIAITSNWIVITAVQKISYIRENVGNFLISSLAFSDLFVGVFILPVKMKYAYNNSQFCSLYLCRYYITADTALFSISITNLLFISIDRFVALNFPYRYKAFMTVRKCKYLIIAIWMYGFTWGLLSNIKWNWYSLAESSIQIKNNQCMVNDNRAYVTTVYVIVFYIPATIMLIIYYRIFCIATFHAKAVYKNGASKLHKETFVLDVPSSTYENEEEKRSNMVPVVKENDNDSGGSTRKRVSKIYTIIRQSKTIFKASKTVATVYGTFFICWFPVSVYALTIAFSSKEDKDIFSSSFHVIFVELLPLINSMLNPFIYAIMNKQYRRAFKAILMKFKRWLAQRFFVCL